MKKHDPVDWAFAIMLASIGLMMLVLAIGQTVHG